MEVESVSNLKRQIVSSKRKRNNEIPEEFDTANGARRKQNRVARTNQPANEKKRNEKETNETHNKNTPVR
jgi:hypothetical protein